MAERMKMFFVCRTTALNPFSRLQPNPHLHKHVPAFICEELTILRMGTDGWGIQNFPLTLQAQHHASCWIELTVLDWVCTSLLLINMGWWGFVLSYEASVVLIHWKRTATESCICCVLMCITKLVKSRRSTPTCNENICITHLVAFFTGWNQGWLGGATHMPC
jgi:hypothetical protein